jgi:hypothetical protein
MRSKFEFILEIFREISSETSMNLEKEKNLVFIVASYSLLFFSLVLLMIVMTYTYFMFVCALMKC